MLTKSQLKKIEEKVALRFLALRFEMHGERALTASEIATLKRAGLLRNTVRNFVGDAFVLGKVAGAITPGMAKKLSFEEIAKLAAKKPTTAIEERAIEYAAEHAGQYIQGIGSDLVKNIRTIAGRSTMTALRKVQDEVKLAIKDRKTVSQLKTALFNEIDNKDRDWYRVASTEMTEAIQQGVYQEIRANSPKGANQLVFKRPSPNACKHCKRVYLEDDGVTPRVFLMNELADSNIGKKSNEWEPTIGPVHPFCQCQLSPIPEGFSFVTRAVVDEPFGDYKRGQVVSLDNLSESDKKKTRPDAILEFTGKTAERSLRKSFDFDASDEADICECKY